MRREKIIRLGLGECGSVFACIKWDGRRLLITGVEGPSENGDCRGSSGQIVMSRPPVELPAPGWTQGTITKFWDIWDRWHLNDMRAECEHQRKRGETRKTNPSAICADCGYRLGSQWLTEDVPSDVIDWLFNLPEPDSVPAWI